MKTIISLCDFSGAWSKPYRDAGYNVVQVDPKLPGGMTAQMFRLALDDKQFRDSLGVVRGILMAPPCTDFSGSGAQWWPAKDADGRTEASLEIVDACLAIKDLLKPAWWVLENPVGRLPTLRPQTLGTARMWFDPCDYGDPYTKRTGLWGEFNMNLPRNPVEPVMYTDKNGKRGSVFWAKLGGKSERTKTLRSMTPPGFAQAFFAANP